MECKYCQKTFSKGEHLRRHERSRKKSKFQSNTGARPFVCKSCKRPFARQDSLARHEKLHERRQCIHYASSPSNLVTPPMTVDTPTSVDVGIARSTTSANGRAQDRAWIEHESSASIDVDDMPPSADLDFELMWPDSELLLQTIISSETANHWQMPLGAMPSTPGAHQPAGETFGTPNSFREKASSIGAIPSGGSHRAVHDVSKLVSNLSSDVTAVAEATSLTSLFLDECLHMFFVRFIPTFPILHRATFVFRDCTHPLLLNAMAVGSLYCGPKDSTAKGEALWRLAHMAVANSWEKLITHQGPYDACKGVQLVLTALLGQVYGALSKNREIRMASQAFYTLGFFWASQCGMFDAEPYSMMDLPSVEDSEAEREHKWKLWAAKEIQQRALLGHYILDGLIARMFGRPTSVRHAANQLGLLSSEVAFEASTANEWITRLRSQEIVSCSFRSVFRSLFTVADNALSVCNTYSTFSHRVILEGLQSLAADCDNVDATVGVPTKFEIRRALVRVHEMITNSIGLPGADRQELLLRWHAICLDICIDQSQLCKYVCSRYGIEQHIWKGGLGVKPELDLIKWANTEDARRALLHAITIQEIVEQLPRGRAHVIHIPSSLFAAATVYTVFSLAGLTQVNLPSIVDWRDVLSRSDDSNFFLTEILNPPTSSDTRRYICGEYPSMFGIPGATRNLLYELNSMQKLFRCLSSQWGIAHDMEDIMDQWITLCH